MCICHRAGRGIGRAIAEGLSEAGADLLPGGRNRDNLAWVAEGLCRRKRTAELFELDVESTASIAEMNAELRFPGVLPEILVNDAGVEEVRPSVDVDERLRDRIADTNLKGAFLVALGFARCLKVTGQSGCVLNMCSLTSLVGVSIAVPHMSSKSCLLGMTRALVQLHSFGESPLFAQGFDAFCVHGAGRRLLAWFGSGGGPDFVGLVPLVSGFAGAPGGGTVGPRVLAGVAMHRSI